MPSQGPLYPGTAGNLSEASTAENAEAWAGLVNVSADDGVNASITAASYDSPDKSQILRVRDFGFTIPTTATLNGIVVEIERNCGAGTAADFRVQLMTGTLFANLVGNNKAAAGDWPASMAIATYGSSSDMWGTTLTPTDVNSVNFCVGLSVQATAANVDIFVDYVRTTIHYTEAGGGAAKSLVARRRMQSHLVR